MIIRNFERGKFLNPLLNASLDFRFCYYILSIILGSFVIYKLLRYYFEFYSLYYLMVALFIFGTVVYLYLWQLICEYFSIITSLLIEGYSAEFVQSCALELAIAGRAMFWVGTLFFFFYVINLRKWKNYNKIEKFFIIILFFDQIIRIILDFFTWISMAFNLIDFNFFWNLTNGTGMAYPGTITGIFASTKIGAPLLVLLTEPVYLIYILLVYNILHSPSIGKSFSMDISKVYWIIFCFFSIAVIFLESITGDPDPLVKTWTVYFAIQIIFLVGLLIILYYGPEAILITDKILFDAKNLYSLLINVQPDLHPIRSVSEFMNYPPRLKTYIESIPENIRKEFEKNLGE